MYGTLLSVLLLGLLPLRGMHDRMVDLPRSISVAAPANVSPEALLVLNDRLTSSGAIVIDFDSGQTVYERGASEPRPMASLTKLMTALLIVEHHDLSDIVTVPPSADLPNDNLELPIGAQFTVGDLLSALLIPSSNAAAVSLAEFHAGSMEAFADAMNERAVALGLSQTSYGNAIGFDDRKQISSPRDLALLAVTVLRHPEIRERMSMTGTAIRSIGGTSLTLTHSHQLLDAPLTASLTGAVVRAGKTGTTNEAGQCLLSIVEAGGRSYVVVLLHSRDRYADMQHVLSSLTQ